MNGNTGKEQNYEEIAAPDCFGYYDGYDPSCKRCKVKDECRYEQEETRPPCFGLLYDESEVECSRCLDASDCVSKYVELKGETEVARKRTIRVRKRMPQPEPEEEEPEVEEEEEESEEEASTPRKRRRVRKPQPEPEEDDVDEDEDAGEYDGWSVKELREELEARDLDTSGRKPFLVKRLLADDAGEEEAEEEKPKSAPKQRRTTRRVRKPQPEPESEEDDVDEDEDEGVPTSPAEILESLQLGRAVILTRVSKTQWQLTVGAQVATTVSMGRGRRGRISTKDFEKEAFSPEYYSYLYEHVPDGDKSWKEMTPDERYEFADEIGAVWEKHENSKTDQMRMAQAVREALGIEKWKPEYDSRAARKELRGY